MSSDSDEPPSRHSAGVDTHEFLFPGAGVSALLIHGLTGTPYEMRYLGERLATRGVRVRGVKLAGHAGTPEELGAAGYDNWYESVVNGLEELRQFGEPNVVIGLSMGAVLAARLAADQGESIAGVAMLAPAFFLPRSTTMTLRGLRGTLGSLVDRIYLLNQAGSDIHDAAARSIHPDCRLMPLSAPMKLLDLTALVKPMLPRIAQPALVIHARRDHTCPMRKNVAYVMKHLGSAEKRAIELEESYHVITVDSEKERVVNEVAEFVERFRVAPQKRAAGLALNSARRKIPRADTSRRDGRAPR
jgi:carboxylesterase